MILLITRDRGLNLEGSLTTLQGAQLYRVDSERGDSSILETFDVLERLSGRGTSSCSPCMTSACPVGQHHRLALWALFPEWE